MNGKYTIGKLQKKAADGDKLVMVTAYDYPFACIAERAGVDMILVGDSLGNVVLGYDTTIPVTMEDMLHHTKAVCRAVKTPLVIADMPYGSYEVSTEEAVRNAMRLIQEGGAQAVKLEGSQWPALVQEMTRRGIPVMAHLGLLPQTASLWHGYKTHGRDEATAWALVEAAQAMEEAGAFAVLLECVASEAAKLITDKIDIPTIGIGSGAACDGQVLVSYDLLGLGCGHTPKFVKQYVNIGQEIEQGFRAFADEVRQGTFPDSAHCVAMEEDEAKRLY
jgi:3-methyl-2-oxobutanoate hydroxymethyltransferase